MFMKMRLKAGWAFAREVWIEFYKDRGALFAAAISFFGLISLVPLMLLAIGIFARIVGSRETALQSVIAFINNFLPMGTDVLESYLLGLKKESSLLSGIGILGLLWAGMQVFVILQEVMNMAMGSVKRVSFARGRAVAIVLVVVAGMLLMLSVGITSLVAVLRRSDPFGLGTNGITAVFRVVGVLVPMIMSILAFTIIYKLCPTRRIGILGALIGGTTAGLLFEFAKNAFPWYTTHVAHFSFIYGSLGSVVVMVIWTYYVSLITVIGAEVTSVYVRREEEKNRS